MNSDLDKIWLISDLPERNCYVSGGVSVFHFSSNLFSLDNNGLERCWIYEVDRQKNIVLKQRRASNWTVASRRQIPLQLYRLRKLHSPVTLITYFPRSSNYPFYNRLSNCRTPDSKLAFIPWKCFFFSWEFLSWNCGHFSSNILCPFSWRLDCHTITVLLLMPCMVTSECVSSKEENENYVFFPITHCSLKTPHGNLTICMGFL